MLLRVLLLLLVASVLGCNNKGATMRTEFRKAIFLHHSTGANIYGLSGSSVTVPACIKKFNDDHGFSSKNQVRMDQIGWPTAEMGWNNEWYRWKSILDGNDKIKRYGLKKLLAPNINVSAEWNKILKNYPIVVIKSCFPSSAIVNEGSDKDLSNLSIKSIYNYKYIWRNIMRNFAMHPDNFFVIWTNTPLAKASTTPEQALLSNAFCKWAKDTLATGLDQEFGPFPENVYVFDFFHYLTSGGILKEDFAISHSDSHPNNTAAEYVAPRLVKEVFNAALNYESKHSKQ